jgi:drug/metabolite transporter (DMT)-like permease
MTWQILLGIHLLFSTAYALLLRQLASEVKGYARLVSAIMYVFVVLPGGVAVAIVLGDISFSFSPAVIGILLLAGVLFAITNIAAYRANEELDAAQFSIITNLESFFYNYGRRIISRRTVEFY